MRRRAGGVLVAGAAALVAGCGGQSVVLPRPTEQTVVRAVVAKTGYRPSDVQCPSGVPAKVGQVFACHFTGPDGKYVARMTIVSVHGRRVNYNIRTDIVDRAILVGPAEQEVSQFVYAHTGFRPTDVACPSGLIAKVGLHYQCHFTGPDGAYTADVAITALHGRSVSNQIVTRRTG